jgi:hypothetical protein
LEPGGDAKLMALAHVAAAAAERLQAV